MVSKAQIESARPRRLNHRLTGEYQLSLWARWPRPEDWPGRLDIYEAAAYLRVAYNTVWRACKPGRDGKACLAHQRLGDRTVICKGSLDRWGAVEQRAPT
jgi:hypothetical protein